jgi:hypothetical protein
MNGMCQCLKSASGVILLHGNNDGTLALLDVRFAAGFHKPECMRSGTAAIGEGS